MKSYSISILAIFAVLALLSSLGCGGGGGTAVQAADRGSSASNGNALQIGGGGVSRGGKHRQARHVFVLHVSGWLHRSGVDRARKFGGQRHELVAPQLL